MYFVTRAVRTIARNRNVDRSNEWTTRFVVILALFAFFWMCIGFITPVMMAGLFAATLYPYHRRLEGRIRSNSMRALVTTSFFAFIFLLPLLIVSFLAANAGIRKFKDLPENWTESLQIDLLLQPLLLGLEGFVPMERSEIVRHLQEFATIIGRSALSLLQNLVADLPKMALANGVILIGIFIFLSEAEGVLNWLRKFSPLSRDKSDRLFSRIGGLSSSSILATIVSGIVQASLIGIVLTLMQFPDALLVTMSAFVLSFLPIIGTTPVAIYLIGSAAFAGNWGQLMVFVATSVVVSISDNLVRPYVLSDTGKLNGFVAFVAAVGALETMGLYGLFLGPVVAGAVLTLVELVHEGSSA